jgi:hypothetical protein
MKQTGSPNRKGYSNLGIGPSKKRTPREVEYFDGIVMINDFIDNDMPHLKPAEIKLVLVIFRKTIGWNKLSDKIGTAQLCKLAKLDKDTVKHTIKPVCEKVGIRIDQECEGGVWSRRRYTWPRNERVTPILEKARRSWAVGGKLPPTGEGQITPQTEGPNPPTQVYLSQSGLSKGGFNFGDRGAYGSDSCDEMATPRPRTRQQK